MQLCSYCFNRGGVRLSAASLSPASSVGTEWHVNGHWADHHIQHTGACSLKAGRQRERIFLLQYTNSLGRDSMFSKRQAPLHIIRIGRWKGWWRQGSSPGHSALDQHFLLHLGPSQSQTVSGMYCSEPGHVECSWCCEKTKVSGLCLGA